MGLKISLFKCFKRHFLRTEIWPAILRLLDLNVLEFISPKCLLLLNFGLPWGNGTSPWSIFKGLNDCWGLVETIWARRDVITTSVPKHRMAGCHRITSLVLILGWVLRHLSPLSTQTSLPVKMENFFVIGQTLSSTTLCQHWEWFHKDCADSIFSRQFLITWFFVNLLYSNTIWSLFFHAGFCLFCRQNARNTPARSYSESHKQLKTSCLLFQNMLLVQVHGNTGVAARLSTYMEKISSTSYKREGFYTRSEYNWKTTPFCKNEMV